MPPMTPYNLYKRLFHARYTFSKSVLSVFVGHLSGMPLISKRPYYEGFRVFLFVSLLDIQLSNKLTKEEANCRRTDCPVHSVVKCLFCYSAPPNVGLPDTLLKKV